VPLRPPAPSAARLAQIMVPTWGGPCRAFIAQPRGSEARSVTAQHFQVVALACLPILVVHIISFAPCCYSAVVDIYKCLMGETFKPRKVGF
jgi:hypothetical protein